MIAASHLHNAPGASVSSLPRSIGAAALLLSGVAVSASAQGQLNQYGYPEKHTPKPTSAAITPGDLMTRLYIFADDSMEGRQSGRVGNKKGTDYIAAELKRLGIEPAGENGGYFQTLPYIQRKFTSKSTLTINGRALRFNDDFVPVPTGVTAAPTNIRNAQVVYGGVAGDTTSLITADQAKGKVVILSAPAGGGAQAMGGRGRMGAQGWMARFSGAAALAMVDLDAVHPANRPLLNEPMATFSSADAVSSVPARDMVMSDGAGGVTVVRDGAIIGGKMPVGMNAAQVKAHFDSLSAPAAAAGAPRPAFGGGAAAGPMPVQIRLTNSAAATLLGAPIEGMAAGTAGGRVSANFDFVSQKTDFGRNVVGIVRGSDPVLRNQFVAIGAHNDHVGFRGAGPVDHDSARAAMMIRLKAQMLTGDLRAVSPALAAALPPVDVEALRKIRPARPDSINNGADDDGSGSMGLLEIAEAIQLMPTKPKRSYVFVWHTAEESGMHGSRHFANNPTVPVDSIVAHINMDMLGRGRAEDIIGGADDYTGILGAFKLSKSFGDLVYETNEKSSHKLFFDDRFDDPTLGTPVNGVVSWPGYSNLYNRSDHTRYAEKCMPIVFFFTGLHADYHQITDEPQYIDYPHYSRVINLIRDVAVATGNTAVRPALDGGCVRQ